MTADLTRENTFLRTQVNDLAKALRTMARTLEAASAHFPEKQQRDLTVRVVHTARTLADMATKEHA